MSYRRPPKPVENYTNAFFTSFGVLLFAMLCAIGAMAGFLWVVLTAFAVDRIGRWIFRRLG